MAMEGSAARASLKAAEISPMLKECDMVRGPYHRQSARGRRGRLSKGGEGGRTGHHHTHRNRQWKGMEGRSLGVEPRSLFKVNEEGVA